MNDNPSSGPKYIITLVHGTFARNAPWTQPDSEFCKSLCVLIARTDLVITRFAWSGWNSPWSRRRAARALRARLADQLASDPEARHYVIGHSHGGALALQAVYAENALPLEVAGVATMSTPFIHTRKRGLAPFSYPEMLTWLCFLPLAGAFAWGVFWPWERYLWGKHDGPAAYTAGLIGLVTAAYMALVIARGLSKTLLRLAKDIDVSLQCSVPDKSNLLIIRTSGDEASAVLAFSQILSWFVSRLWSLVGMLLRPIFSFLRVLERFSQLVPAILIVWCFASLLIIMTAVSIGYAAIGAPQHASNFDRLIGALQTPVELFIEGANRHDIGQMVQMGLFGVIILIGGTFALLACFVLPALIISSIVLLPFGPESALSALLVEVSVEPVPPGRWCINQYAWAEGASDGLLALAHSAPYDDPRARSLLASWIVQSGG